MCAPTEEEIAAVCTQLHIDADLVRAALDEEERSRIDSEDGHMLILVDTPTVEVRPGRGFVYTTLPYGIILTEANIVTVCLKETALTRAFSDSPVKSFSTKKQRRMTLQMLYRNATLFLFYPVSYTHLKRQHAGGRGPCGAVWHCAQGRGGRKGPARVQYHVYYRGGYEGQGVRLFECSV